jgi:hypothetical protein
VVNLKTNGRAALRLLALAAALVPAWSGCSSVIGIEEARLDVGTGTGGAPVAQSLCEKYCASAMTNCTGDFKLYFSTAECLTTCAVFDEGSEGDKSGNTVSCRLRFADLAGTVGEPSVNCPAAGPGGNGRCGSNCEGFCAMALAACGSFLPELPRDFEPDQCEEFCGTLPDSHDFDIRKDVGDSVQCRIYHSSAATIDPDTHCRHVAGVGPCARATGDAGAL